MPFRGYVPAEAAAETIRIKTGTRPRPLIALMRLASAILILATALFPAEAASGPLRVSQTGRYFVDANGEPFYFLADTQWELFRRYSPSEAELILENRKAKGFNIVMVMLTGVGDGTGPNLEGHHPWLNDDPATPNPAYFNGVDAVVRQAQANDIQLLIGIYHQTYGNRMTVDNPGRGRRGSRADTVITQTSFGRSTRKRQIPTNQSSPNSPREFRKGTVADTSSRSIPIRRRPPRVSCMPSAGSASTLSRFGIRSVLSIP